MIKNLHTMYSDFVLTWNYSPSVPLSTDIEMKILRPRVGQMYYKKANLRDLIAATGLVILLKLDSNHRFFSPCDLEICQALCIISMPSVNSNCSYSPETHNLGQNQQFFEPCDLKIWRMTLKNNRASLLCYFNVSFRSHWWIQTAVSVRKRPIWVKFDAF